MNIECIKEFIKYSIPLPTIEIVKDNWQKWLILAINIAPLSGCFTYPKYRIYYHAQTCFALATMVNVWFDIFPLGIGKSLLRLLHNLLCLPILRLANSRFYANT
jgi:hypothetical protein